jgi:hypothetical protein
MTAPEGMIEAQLLQVRGWVLFGFCPSGQACPGGWGAVRLLSVPSAPTRLLLLLLNRRSPVSGGLGSISLFLPAPPIPTFNFPPSTSHLTVFFFLAKERSGFRWHPSLCCVFLCPIPSAVSATRR